MVKKNWQSEKSRMSKWCLHIIMIIVQVDVCLYSVEYTSHDGSTNPTDCETTKNNFGHTGLLLLLSGSQTKTGK